MSKRIGSHFAITTAIATIALVFVVTDYIAINGLQQAFADTSGPKNKCLTKEFICWCYSVSSGASLCLSQKSDCQKAQKLDIQSTSPCFKKPINN